MSGLPIANMDHRMTERLTSGSVGNVSWVQISDAPIWNLADIPIADTGSEISADIDSRSDIQLCSNFLPFSSNFLPFST